MPIVREPLTQAERDLQNVVRGLIEFIKDWKSSSAPDGEKGWMLGYADSRHACARQLSKLIKECANEHHLDVRSNHAIK
jgi:hypothetical protein